MIGEIEREAEHMLESRGPAGPADAAAQGEIDRLELARVVFVALAAAAVWFRVWEPIASVDVLGVAATLIGGYPIFKEALQNVLERRMTMELSMTLALVAALAIGQVFTALVITAFVLGAEILEHLTVARGRKAIGDLLRYLPRTALVRRNGAIRSVSADALTIGDAVLVNPGSFVPVDGIVLAGTSFVDEAHVTGEPMPSQKVPGSRAYAGTVNQRGALEIRAERLGRDTSFGRIIDAVESAETSRAPIQRLADRLSSYLVYFALGAAVLTYAITRNVVATISVIIVAGACGVAAGTPLAVLGAVGRAARAGAIVKGGRYLEAIAGVTTVVFDKTGTVTIGRPAVSSLTPASGISKEEVLQAAAVAEGRSEHPLGRAIVAEAARRSIAAPEPEDFVYEPGRGIRARLEGTTILAGSAAFLGEAGFSIVRNTWDAATTDVHVASGGRYLGVIGIVDALRPEARASIAGLKRLGIRVVLLTGDVRPVADAVGRALAFDEVVAELLPEQKSAYVAELVASGRIVAMVGDGINDAPALVRATVGVAMGSGTDVTRECADVVLLGNDLSRLVETVLIARRMKTIVLQNFVGTIAVDAIGIGLAAFGLLDPLAAAFVHVASELTFILNSTRMLPARVRLSQT